MPGPWWLCSTAAPAIWNLTLSQGMTHSPPKAGESGGADRFSVEATPAPLARTASESSGASSHRQTTAPSGPASTMISLEPYQATSSVQLAPSPVEKLPRWQYSTRFRAGSGSSRAAPGSRRSIICRRRYPVADIYAPPVSSSCLVAPCRAARRLSLIAVQSHGGSVCPPLPTALDAAALDRIGAVEQAVQMRVVGIGNQDRQPGLLEAGEHTGDAAGQHRGDAFGDRKSTRLNSSH